MWVDRGRFRPADDPGVERLTPADATELNRLYQLGFGAWLPPQAIADGVYYGLRVNGRLVAAAGTHVVSPAARMAVVGNVLTHGDFRGRGYATAVTGAVTAELLKSCDDVVLNVRADNPPALSAYRHLGYAEHVRFEERLAHRLGSAWSELAQARPPPPQPRKGASAPMTLAQRSGALPPTTSPTSAAPPRASGASSGRSGRCRSSASSASGSPRSARSRASASARASTSPPRRRT